jgi:hypothetical protein
MKIVEVLRSFFKFSSKLPNVHSLLEYTLITYWLFFFFEVLLIINIFLILNRFILLFQFLFLLFSLGHTFFIRDITVQKLDDLVLTLLKFFLTHERFLRFFGKLIRGRKHWTLIVELLEVWWDLSGIGGVWDTVLILKEFEILLIGHIFAILILQERILNWDTWFSIIIFIDVFAISVKLWEIKPWYSASLTLWIVVMIVGLASFAVRFLVRTQIDDLSPITKYLFLHISYNVFLFFDLCYSSLHFIAETVRLFFSALPGISLDRNLFFHLLIRVIPLFGIMLLLPICRRQLLSLMLDVILVVHLNLG